MTALSLGAAPFLVAALSVVTALPLVDASFSTGLALTAYCLAASPGAALPLVAASFSTGLALTAYCLAASPDVASFGTKLSLTL